MIEVVIEPCNKCLHRNVCYAYLKVNSEVLNHLKGEIASCFLGIPVGKVIVQIRLEKCKQFSTLPVAKV